MQNENPNHRILKTGNYAGLKFRDGWLFIHVLETEFIELKPWILLNESGNREAIAAETAGSADDEIVDEVGRQLVEPQDEEQNLVFQLMTGVAPSRMQIYPRFGRDRAPNLVGGAEPQSPQVPFNGYDSPYNNPSTQSEIFTVNGMDSLQLQAYNPMDEPQEARVSFHVNKMKYTVIEDVNKMRAFIQGQLPFRDHAMGLGSQEKDQVRAPGWMQSAFGDLMYSTEEILTQSSGNDTSSLGTGTPTFPEGNME
jgi:hypothetical protein